MIRPILPSNYQIERPISAGGQGAVFLGKRNGTEVALKLFTTFEIERLEREIDLLQKDPCPYLVKLIDVHILDLEGTPIPMLVYEYIEGEDLRPLIKAPDIVDQSLLIIIGEHISNAMEHLWSKRVVHRDIKPGNIIQAVDGRFILVDVGFAQHLDLATITAGGQPGTPGYKSPEQCGGRKRLTIHSDIFSLGVTLFEVAAKKHPWDHNQLFTGRTQPRKLSELRPDLYPELRKLIHNMMHPHPGLRPNCIYDRFCRLGGK